MSETFECRWGGPSDNACWNIGACGCCPTSVEEVWRKAHAEQLRRVSREVFDAFAAALRLPQITEWLNARLTR